MPKRATEGEEGASAKRAKGEEKRAASLPLSPSKKRGEAGQHLDPQWQDIKKGNASDVVKLLREAGVKKDERDGIGATPLLLAELYAPSNMPQDRSEARRRTNGRALTWEENEGHEKIVRGIFNAKDRTLSSLWTVGYDRDQYEGETVLHLAIAKRRGDDVRLFLEACTESEQHLLVNSRVVGTFEFAHFKTPDGVMRCKFGEHPVCWAACTNQPEIVDYLFKKGARADCQTLHGDTVLHMLIRWSGWLKNDEAELANGSSTGEHGEWLLDMFDKMLEKILDTAKDVEEEGKEGEGAALKKVLNIRNADDLSPILLASVDRVASKKMFNHVLKKHMQTMWIVGPYRGILVDVDQVDPVAAKLQLQASGAQARPHTVLSLLVKSQNELLFENRYIQAIIETKWKLYARCELHYRLLHTLLMLVLLFRAQMMPLTDSAALFAVFNSQTVLWIYTMSRISHLLCGVGCQRLRPVQFYIDSIIAIVLVLTSVFKSNLDGQMDETSRLSLPVACGRAVLAVVSASYVLVLALRWSLPPIADHDYAWFELEGFKFASAHTWSLLLVCGVSFLGDTAVAGCFFDRGGWRSGVALEFSVWQGVLYLYILPWLSAMTHPLHRVRRGDHRGSFFAVVLSYVITWLIVWADEGGLHHEKWGLRWLQVVFADGHRLRHATAGDPMVLMISVRSQVCVWLLLMIGAWRISSTECSQIWRDGLGNFFQVKGTRTPKP